MASTSPPKQILFYGKQDPFYQFSNFYSAPISIDSKIWPTTEHYFQAMKFPDVPEFQEKVRLETAPSIAKKMVTERVGRRGDWDDVKIGVMHKCCKEKFLQHPDLKKVLLSTGDAELIEHTKNDKVWADGGDGTGRNELGKVLMAIRKEIVEMENVQNKK